MIPLGHRTYLATKVKGDNSMFGKAGCRETINRHARQDPDGTVKARPLEAKYPNCKCHNLDTMVDIQGSQTTGRDIHPVQGDSPRRSPQHAPREMGCHRQPEGYEMATYTILNVTHTRNAGLPTGREPYGNGVPIVVRGRESRPHGEGGQVSTMEARGGMRDAER